MLDEFRNMLDILKTRYIPFMTGMIIILISHFNLFKIGDVLKVLFKNQNDVKVKLEIVIQELYIFFLDFKNIIFIIIISILLFVLIYKAKMNNNTYDEPMRDVYEYIINKLLDNIVFNIISLLWVIIKIIEIYIFGFVRIEKSVDIVLLIVNTLLFIFLVWKVVTNSKK